MASKPPDELDDPAGSEPPARCRECGEPLGDAVRFCTFCGAPIDEPTGAEPTGVEQPAVEPVPSLSPEALARQRARRWRRRRRLLGVLAFLAVVVALGVVIVMATSDSDDDAASTAVDGGSKGSGSSSTTTTLPPAGPYEVTDGLNVRAGPGTTFPSLGTIEVGNEVHVLCVIDGEAVATPLGANTKWLRIQTPGPTAYVSAIYVATGADITNPGVIPVCTTA